MSDLILNLRILEWHLQVTRKLRFRISRNSYHQKNNWPDGKWRLYTLGSFHF